MRKSQVLYNLKMHCTVYHLYQAFKVKTQYNYYYQAFNTKYDYHPNEEPFKIYNIKAMLV